MSNPNFVNDLVMMAKAFEELPLVKEELDHANRSMKECLERIQSLELKLIDRANELDAAHATIRKVEVERDHAERMFLETDDRLNAFRRLLAGFQTEAGALIAAAEPEPKPEPAIEPVKVEIDDGSYTDDPRLAERIPTDESGQSAGFTVEPERVIEALTVGAESAADPTSAPTPNSPTSPIPEVATEASSAASVESTSTEAVSVQPDPTPVTESSSESGSSGSASPQHEVQPDGYKEWLAEQEAAKPVDPTASSTAGDGHSPADVHPTDAVAEASVSGSETQTSTAPSVVDDVGYHNEPKIDHTKHGADAWAEWDAWCARMNTRYGSGGWPPRQQAAQ